MWISSKDSFPADGQEVVGATSHGQIKQVVRDKRYSGGWKQANCHGWECVSFDENHITHWRVDVFPRPWALGPEDAPWR